MLTLGDISKEVFREGIVDAAAFFMIALSSQS